MAALGVLVAVGGSWVVLALPDKDGGTTPPGYALITLISGAVITAAAVVFSRVDLRLDPDGVHVSFGPWAWPRRDITWSEVRRAAVVEVRALPWGGWGYRWNPWKKGTAALMRRGPGIEFHLTDGSVLVVTVDNADAGAAAAQQWCSTGSGHAGS